MSTTKLPALLAGPMLRHCDEHQVNFFLVMDKSYELELSLSCDGHEIEHVVCTTDNGLLQTFVMGERAVAHFMTANVSTPLMVNQRYDYQIKFSDEQGKTFDLSSYPELNYRDTPLNFVIKNKLNKVLHGSCRKPHFPGEDGLLRVDQAIENSLEDAEQRPALLMMSGDQVYCDDVCGATLNAIHQVIAMLGLYDEQWQLAGNEGHEVNNSQALREHEQGYYQRHLLLPHESINHGLINKLFGASKQPIFTSVNAKNHLVTASEVFALYLLTWSPTLWQLVDLNDTSRVPEQFIQHYQRELEVIKHFASGLGQVQRALAHIPTYMIFDDHDITDDWNLTRAWEEAAYQNSFSKRIIGNALLGYAVFQGWGNAPSKINALLQQINQNYCQGSVQHDELVDQLLDFDEWHYHLNTSPKMVVLDTRTSRWRSESFAGKPSGLMDWESLCEMQQELIGQPSVILVSAAPIYGVKLIETIQRIVTFFGKPLMVDAENWMAHSGTANVMLNIFRHHKTPPNFIILSGDVHYSFVYEVEHRFILSQSRILQVTCSGIKNEFPARALAILAKLNIVLYASYSPLNWFTKRRRMKIKSRKPSVEAPGKLVNQSGIGLLEVSDDHQAVTKLLTASGQDVEFPAIKEEDDG